ALALETSGAKANLTLRATDDGAVLWALHREELDAAAEAPASFHPPRVSIAEADADREALRDVIAREFHEAFGREIERARAAAERTLERRIAGLLADRARARERLLDRRRAEVLLANYGAIPRGASRVELPDPYADSPGALLEIGLDPALSPQENAARLFRHAKRGERGEEMIEDRLARSRKSLKALSEVHRVLADRPPKEAWKELSVILDEAGVARKSARGDRRTESSHRRSAAAPRAGRPGHRSPGARESIRPRTFVSSDGWEIWVGRSNTENDLITHRLSNPHDLWFHVVGVPGSHVILRRPSRNAIPKPRTLEEAAAVAAYYSKARKLTRVPVIYTERKFVSKPRRGKPGQAICTRERELLVRPAIPAGGSGASDTND
ncbi:MAG: NFACT RNA binding domain-containing protein, partial [Hyphomicrobiales bacterium]